MAEDKKDKKEEIKETAKKFADTTERGIHWIVTLSENLQKAKQRMPGLFGLSKADEQIFAGLSADLDVDESNYISDLLDYFPHDHQRRDFRLVVAGISNKKEIKDGTTYVETIMGLKFLKKLAEMVKDHGVEKAYRFCLVREIIHEDKMSRQMLEWGKTQLMGIFGVNSLEEIGVEKINSLFKPGTTARNVTDNALAWAQDFHARCIR